MFLIVITTTICGPDFINFQQMAMSNWPFSCDKTKDLDFRESLDSPQVTLHHSQHLVFGLICDDHSIKVLKISLGETDILREGNW